METDQILTLLLAERERLNRAIQALQSPEKRRGRPPKASSSTAAAPSKKRGGWTAAKRKAQAAKIKAYWAKRRKQTTQRGKA